MNLGQMQTLLFRYGFDPNDPVTSVLNGAMHEIETMFDWPFLEGLSSGLWPMGQSMLTLSSDFLKPIYLKDTDRNHKLHYWDRRKFARRVPDETLTGTPRVYTITNMNLVQIWRVPSIAFNYELLYQAQTPDMVNSGDVPTCGGMQWPTTLHFPIVYRAAAVMLQMENEEDRAKTAQDQFERAILSCMGKFSERELDEVETVEDAQGYGTYDYYYGLRRN